MCGCGGVPRRGFAVLLFFFFFRAPPKLFQQHTISLVAHVLSKSTGYLLFNPLLSSLLVQPSVISQPHHRASARLALSTPVSSNTSPYTHAPLWTRCSCRCLPMKPRGRKSISYHRPDCRCPQWDEQI